MTVGLSGSFTMVYSLRVFGKFLLPVRLFGGTISSVGYPVPPPAGGAREPDLDSAKEQVGITGGGRERCLPRTKMGD